MNKEQRKAYLLSKHIDPCEPGGEITSGEYVIDEVMSENAAYEEHQISSEKPLTSDE